MIERERRILTEREKSINKRDRERRALTKKKKKEDH